MHRTIYLHADAPPKPPEGAACNGCGVCCTIAPCPVGMVISGRRTGPCNALVWHDDAAQYRCGLLTNSTESIARRVLQPLVRRLVGAGIGCDCDVDADAIRA